MLITLSYVYLWLRFHRGYAGLLRDTLPRLQLRRLSFSFCRSPGALRPGALRRCTAAEPLEEPQEPLQKPQEPLQEPQEPLQKPQEPLQKPQEPLQEPQEPLQEPQEPGLFLQLGDSAVYVTEPQTCSDLSRWTVLRSSSAPLRHHISFIIEAEPRPLEPRPLEPRPLEPRPLEPRPLEPRPLEPCPTTTRPKALGWLELCVPLAWCPLTPGEPFRALAQASLEDFGRLGVAFLEERLQLDGLLWPSKILPVFLEESVVRALLEKPPALLSLLHLSVDEGPVACGKGSLHLPSEHPPHEHLPRLDERRASVPLHPDSGLRCDPGSQQHMEEHGHHLHLSSCHECLELENSTILSVKYASVENLPELPDDGAALSGTENLEENLEDSSSNACADISSKPPNILVYTGESTPRFQSIQKVLSKCIDMNKYMMYQLSPAQALGDPWLDNCRLLVVAEEEEALSAHLQTRFLTYLSGGGRVLGLASRLCPAGVSLERLEGEGRVGTLSFTREDSTTVQLRVHVSGHVFTRDAQGGGEVELWGELSGGQMVIVRVTHGDDGGEAVLCQVHLDRCVDLASAGLGQATDAEELRLEVLEEVLRSLGLSCEPSAAPSPTPVHLLSTSTEAKSEFVKWLRSRADDGGLLRLPKVSFRLVSRSEAEADLNPVEGPVPLVWDGPGAPCPEHFNLQTYESHLRSRSLGRTLLYAEVVSSTMDLLDGLNLQVPGAVGLVAVAARQTQGKGRSRNGWLSPVGCAMFTVCLQVELSSRLGQRIPFLQHLAALAVVQAVRTLPGYEELDLRVKWPNDIYHGERLKLGGVLVTSTVLGSTFHLLVGCGFNVSNSSPTVCINDLILKHNQEHGVDLQPLTCAQLIARSLSLLEDLMGLFQREGPDAILPTYYSRWLHSGTVVRLWSEDGPEANVVGLDQNGFLQVHCPKRGLLSLEPDGNSFDMLKNLLVLKHH